MEIAPGVHAIRLRNVYAFLIAEPQLMLIDAGLIGSGKLVREYVESIGRSLDDLARIVCTHAHPDHIGGVRELAGEREVEVLMHPSDLAGLSVTKALIAWPSTSSGTPITATSKTPSSE